MKVIGLVLAFTMWMQRKTRLPAEPSIFKNIYVESTRKHWKRYIFSSFTNKHKPCYTMSSNITVATTLQSWQWFITMDRSGVLSYWVFDNLKCSICESFRFSGVSSYKCACDLWINQGLRRVLDSNIAVGNYLYDNRDLLSRAPKAYRFIFLTIHDFIAVQCLY